MTIEGEYVPSTSAWVREQVAAYEASGGTEANTLRDTGIPVIVVTMRGRATGSVASMGGAPTNPVWYHNLVADPHNVMVQDGPAPFEVDVREVTGDERAAWWERSVAVFPNYADYQAKTARTIPVLVASPR